MLRTLRPILLPALLAVSLLSLGHAARPADPDLIPEARAVLTYLESIYQVKSLAGANGLAAVESIRKACGKEPAIVTFDLSGWNSPPWGASYNGVVARTLQQVKTWHEKGGLVTLQLHWVHPSNPDGSAWVSQHGKKKPSAPFAFADALKPGTKAHGELMRDLKGHADALQQLADARIPVLWRPFHEIEGGWFWWTDVQKPENTAALWRLMFDYFTKERGLHNLIWVYSAALRCGKGPESVEAVAQRKRFYPGARYVDIAGIDIYPNEPLGLGKPQQDAYAKSFAVMQKVAPGKMLALCECEAMPDPETMRSKGPKWLYSIPWWPEGKRHSAEWIRWSYPHDFMVTRDELPLGLGRTP